MDRPVSGGTLIAIYDDHRGTSGTGAPQRNVLLGHLPPLLHPGEPRAGLHMCFGIRNGLAAVAAHRWPVTPLLTNLGDDPAAVQARADAQVDIRVGIRPIPESDFRCWERTAAR